MKNAILLLALAGCYQRDVANCAVSCATSNDCPSGLACTAVGRCAASATDSCGGDTDAPADDGPIVPGIVQVLVLDDRGLPATGVRVIASAFADGAAFDEATTLADGTATLEVSGEADITAVVTNGVGSQLTTIRAIAPGASVTFGRRRNEPATVTRTISWTTDPSATTYFINTSCGIDKSVTAQAGGTNSTTIQLPAFCANDFDVMVVFGNAAFQTFSQFAGNNAGNVLLDDGFTSFALTEANFSQLPSSSEVSNINFTGTSIFRTSDPAFGPGSLGPVAGGGGGGTANLQFPSNGSVGRELVLTLGRNGDEFEQLQQVVERIPAQGAYNLAVEPQLLPWISSNPTVDLAARLVTWIEIPGGATARTNGDLIAVELNYERGSADFRWRIIMPPTLKQSFGRVGGFQLALPDLPGDEVFEPQAGDTLGFNQHLRIYGFSAAQPISYADVAPTADLALSFAPRELFRATDTFLTTDLGAIDLTRMVVSFNPPNAP
jgi:hypothetical protein